MKPERTARDFGESVATGAEQALDWAAPKVDTAVKWAVPRLEKGIESASPKIQEGLTWAAKELSDTVAKVSPMIQDSLDRVGPRISAAIDDATPRVQKAVDRATPALNEAMGKASPAFNHARDVVLNEYLPTANEKIGNAAKYTTRKLDQAKVPEALHEVSEKLKPSAKTVSRLQDTASAAVGHVSKELEKAQKPAKKKRGWLIVAVIAAATAAGVAAWRASKPIDDPWKTPTPVEPTTVRASGPVEVPASVEEVRDEVASSAAEAKAHAAEATEDAKDAVEDAAEAAKVTVSETKEKLSEKAEELSEAAATAKHKAEETTTDSTPKPGPRSKN